MKFLARLFGKRPDPTLAWEMSHAPMPDYDLSRMSFGRLRFGDPLDSIAFLGRPDRFEWTHGDYCKLLYASRGFQLDCDEGRFVCLAFLIGPDEFLPQHEALTFSKPRVKGCGPGVIQLSRDTDRASLERLFGKPRSTDVDSDETILFYDRQGVTMEFELDGKTGRLKRWSLYPT